MVDCDDKCDLEPTVELEREELRDHLFVAANNAGAAEAVIAHDAALRERVEELEEKLQAAGRALDQLDDADWERLCEAVSWEDPDGFDVLDELAADARARQALEAQDDRE